MGFDTADLLRQAGYSEGDIVTVASFGPVAKRTFDTTSSTFVDDVIQFIHHPQWRDHVPEGVTGFVSATGNVLVGTGETVDIRVTDEDDGEVLAKTTGLSSSQRFHAEWTEYEPSNPDNSMDMRVQIRAVPGNNTSTLEQPDVHFGIGL